MNISVLNIEAPKYIKQRLTSKKGEIDKNTVIVESFNTPLTSMDQSFRQEIKEETMSLNDTLDFTL